jgi:GAF domain-containing protein
MVVQANWYSGQGMPPTPVGTRYQQRIFPGIDAFLVSESVVFDDIQQDERFNEEMQALFRKLRIRAMAALPLWAGGQQTGVLLLQSETVYQLSEDEVQPFVSLLGQVAVAVENRRLLAEMNAALAEVEATQHRYLVQSWETYKAGQRAQGYEQVREGISLTDSELLVQLPVATGRQQLSAGEQSAVGGVERSDAPSSLVVPLTVRDEVIGMLGLQEMYERAWTLDEVALVEAIAEQLAQAYENLRLIDETQLRAAREGRISEIGERVREAQSLEEALQIAVREVGQSLEISQAVVSLGISDT